MSNQPVPRIDPTDPRRPQEVVLFSMPKQWKEEADLDYYSLALSSTMVISGAAMITRRTPVAFLALIVAIANVINSRPIRASDSTNSPWSSLIFAIASVTTLIMPKTIDQAAMRASQTGAQAPLPTT